MKSTMIYYSMILITGIATYTVRSFFKGQWGTSAEFNWQIWKADIPYR